MRAVSARVLVGLMLAGIAAAGCSRPTPPGGAETPPPPPVAKEDRAKDVKPSLVLAAAIEAPPATPPAPPPPSLAGKKVLHVGDSMVGGQWGLTRALEAKFAEEGAKLVRDYKVSESIASFDKSPKLKELLARHEPDIVILTLGTNDALVPYPQALAPHVQSIVKRIGARECYWMGPPLWKPDTGILAVIRENAGACRFYDASHLKLQRGGDGIHPTDKGGADWADQFWIFFRGGDAKRAEPLTDAGVP